jgi:hypothetical protein
VDYLGEDDFYPGGQNKVYDNGLSLFWPFVDRVVREAMSQLAAESSMTQIVDSR